MAESKEGRVRSPEGAETQHRNLTERPRKAVRRVTPRQPPSRGTRMLPNGAIRANSTDPRRTRRRRNPGTPPLQRAGTRSPDRALSAQRQIPLASKAGSPQASPRMRRPTTAAKGGRRRRISPLTYATRLIILGIGIGAIAGTLLSAWDPASRDLATQPDATPALVQPQPSKPLSNWTQASFFGNNISNLRLKSELTPLKTEIQALAKQYPQLTPGIFLLDLEAGSYVDFNGTTAFAAASTIKLPILAAFFQDIDAGKIQLDELLPLKPEHVATGAGELQYQPVGTQYAALEVATKMITISDNTATNMLIERLGGAEALNQRFNSWGLRETVIRNPLPDVEGTNTTSPQELVKVLAAVNQGDLVSTRSRDRLIGIMQQTQTYPLIKSGLDTGATLANKTGTIGIMLADVGLVDTPTGKRYIIAAMVKRPFNDLQAEELIGQVSRASYLHFSPPTTTPNPASIPNMEQTPNPALIPNMEQAPVPSLQRPNELPGAATDATAKRR